MSENPYEQIFNDLYRYLEVLETQNSAILQLLKDKKVVSEKKFASYLEQAAIASDVKWRAARVRMEHLLASVPEPKAQSADMKAKEVSKTESGPAETAKADDKEPKVKKPQQDSTANESLEKSSEARTGQSGDNEQSTNAPKIEAKDAAKVGKSDDDNSKNQTSGHLVSTEESEKASFQAEEGSRNGATPTLDKTKESSAGATEPKTQGEGDAANAQKTQRPLTEEEQEKVA